MDLKSKWFIKQDYLQKHTQQLSAVKVQSFQFLQVIPITVFQFHLMHLYIALIKRKYIWQCKLREKRHLYITIHEGNFGHK